MSEASCVSTDKPFEVPSGSSGGGREVVVVATTFFLQVQDWA